MIEDAFGIPELPDANGGSQSSNNKVMDMKTPMTNPQDEVRDHKM